MMSLLRLHWFSCLLHSCSLLACLTNSSVSKADFVYSEHDGTAENALGISLSSSARHFRWGTVFEVNDDATILTSLNVGFGQNVSGNPPPPPLAGQSVAWQIFGDSDDDPRSGLTPLTNMEFHTIVNVDYINRPVKDEIPLNNIDVSGYNYIFAGLSHDDSAIGARPAAWDANTSSNNAWFGIGTTHDPGQVFAQITFRGTYIIDLSTQSVPEPSSALILLGFAAGGLVRRRFVTK